MKKIFSLLFIVLLSVSYVFAQDEIQTSVSDTQVSLGENFTMSITIDTAERQSQNISFDIPGIDNFQIFSQSQSYSYRNINGDMQGSMQYVLDMKAINEGEFSLGPVRVLTASGELLDDKTITISVGSQAISKPGENEDFTDSDITHEGGENISNLKADRVTKFPWGLLISFIIFLGAFYFVLAAILKNKNQAQADSVSVGEEKVIGKNKKIIQYFSKLGAENDTLSSQEFFKNYNTGIREVFSQRGVKNAHKITLSELSTIEDIEDDTIFPLFKRSYKYEYAGVDISPETRKKYIIDILGILEK